MSFLDTWRRWMGNETHDITKQQFNINHPDAGIESYSGLNVTQESALRHAAVWRCIRLISETLAGLPADIVRKRGDIREPVERPPTWLQTPNPESNWFEFTERVYESLLMDGNTFALITARDFQGFPSELWVLHPARVQIRRDESSRRIYFLVDGEVRYSRFGPDEPLGDILHVRLATAGGLRGISPIEAMRQAVGLGLVTEKFGSKFFGQGQQMSGVIQLPEASGARSQEHIELMRETWQAAHSGSDRAHRPAVLTGGATWQGITIPPEDAQFLQTRTFQVEEIARFYGVPAHLIGLEQKNTSWGTGIESQGQAFYRSVLRGHIQRYETAMSQLVPRGNFLRLNPRALLEADLETEAKVLQMQLQNGVINFNDWRAILDKPPRPGGDRYILPLNFQILTPGGVAEPTPEPAPSPNGKVPAEVTDGQTP